MKGLGGSALLFLALLVAPVCAGEEQPSQCSPAEEKPVVRARLVAFAQEWFDEGEYYRAITEYRRFLSYYPDDPAAEDVQLRIFDCYFGAGHIVESLAWARRLHRAAAMRGHVSPRLELDLGRALLQLNDAPGARHHLAAAAALVGADAETVGAAWYEMGRAYLQDEQWQEAAAAFASVPAASPQAGKAQAAAVRALAGSSLPRKSGRVAAVLSVVPGVGYIYVDETQSAVSSVFLNVLFGAATYSAFSSGAEGLGVLLGFVSLSYYSGSIYGSVVGAGRFNEREKQAFLDTF